MNIPYRKRQKEERNKELLNDYVSGLPIKDIQTKFKISNARIFAIISRARKETAKETDI